MAVTIASRLSWFLISHGIEPVAKRSDFTTHVAVPLVRGAWAAIFGRAPSATKPLDDVDADRLDAILDDRLAQTLVAADRACDRVFDLLAQRADAVGVKIPRDKASERACTRVGRTLRDQGTLDEDTCHSIADDVFFGIMGSVAMGPKEFAEAFAAVYDEAWAGQGCASISTWPPTDIALGHDMRPSLLPDPANQGRNWAQGSDRDVYGRYLLHHKDSARGRPPRCSRGDCANPPPASVRDPGREECQRACLPYGLAHAAHRSLLRSVAFGLEAEREEADGWLTWEKWASPCQPIAVTPVGHDLDVEDAVASALAAWRHTDVGSLMVNQYGMAELLGPLRRTAVRKIWMDAHRFEREHAEPMRRCAVVRSVRAVLYHTFPGAYHEWLQGHLDGVDEATMLDPCGGQMPPAAVADATQPDGGPAAGDRTSWPAEPHAPTAEDLAEHSRQQHTIDLLTGHVDLVIAMRENGSDWRDEYEDLVEADPERFLVADAAYKLLIELVKGMD